MAMGKIRIPPQTLKKIIRRKLAKQQDYLNALSVESTSCFDCCSCCECCVGVRCVPESVSVTITGAVDEPDIPCDNCSSVNATFTIPWHPALPTDEDHPCDFDGLANSGRPIFYSRDFDEISPYPPLIYLDSVFCLFPPYDRISGVGCLGGYTAFGEWWVACDTGSNYIFDGHGNPGINPTGLPHVLSVLFFTGKHFDGDDPGDIRGVEGIVWTFFFDNTCDATDIEGHPTGLYNTGTSYCLFDTNFVFPGYETSIHVSATATINW